MRTMVAFSSWSIEQISVLIETDFFISNLDAQNLVLNMQELIFNTVTKVYTGLTEENLCKMFNEDLPVVQKFLAERKDQVTVAEDGSIVVKTQAPPTVYQQVYEKTKAFNFKTNQIDPWSKGFLRASWLCDTPRCVGVVGKSSSESSIEMLHLFEGDAVSKIAISNKLECQQLLTLKTVLITKWIKFELPIEYTLLSWRYSKKYNFVIRRKWDW